MIEVGPHIDFVLAKLRWMREQKIWPNGLRYLWTDAFGVVPLVSLCKHLREQRYLDEAEWLVDHPRARTPARHQDWRGIPDNISPWTAIMRAFSIDQDLGLGMMLWLAHFLPGRAMGKGSDSQGAGDARSMCDRSRRAISAARTQHRQLKFAFYKLRRLARASGRATTAGLCHPAQFVHRHLPVE